MELCIYHQTFSFPINVTLEMGILFSHRPELTHISTLVPTTVKFWNYLPPFVINPITLNQFCNMINTCAF